jgi:hypothetical protein
MRSAVDVAELGREEIRLGLPKVHLDGRDD